MKVGTMIVGAGLALVLALGATAWSASGEHLRNVGMGVGDFDTDWTVGACHRLDQPEQVDPMFPSDTSPAVPCDSPHQSETYAVIPLTGAVAAPPRRPSPLWLERALTGACAWSGLAGYLGAGPSDTLRDVRILQILPSGPEWRRGVREIRCDVLIGPRDSASVASIAQPLKDLLTRPAGARFRVCRLNYAEVACDQEHDSDLVYPAVHFTDAELAKDTHAQKIEKMKAVCAPEVAAFLGTPLAERPDLALYPEAPGDAPHPGSRAGQCWIGPAYYHVYRGSLRRSGSHRLPWVR